MIELRGFGLFGGQRVSVQLTAHAGPFEVRVCGEQAALHDCVAEAGALCTEIVLPSGARIRGFEHLAGAAAGLGLHRGVRVELVHGNELPLLDGCASAWCHALQELGVPRSPARLRVVRSERFEIEGALYELEPGEEPRVHAELRTDHPLLERHATWHTDDARFVDEIASARTFAFATDLAAYAARGVHPHVAPEQVVVVGTELHAAGKPAAPSEPVRHKLLDLMGDLFVHGGPPRGTVRARAPGHAKTHAALRLALRAGVLASLLLAPRSSHAQRFEPSPLALPTLDHGKLLLTTDTRVGFFVGDGGEAHGNGAVLKHGYALELPVLPRRVYLGARYAFASGRSLEANTPGAAPGAHLGETVSGNTMLHVRSLWIAPAGLALGGALEAALPTALYPQDSTAGDVATAAQAMSPNDWLGFRQRAFGLRPSFDVRIRAAGFTFQLRQSLSFAIGIADGSDSGMVAEVGLYAGQQVGPVQIGLELAELYYLDTLLSRNRDRSDASRARFMIMPQVRLARGPIRPAFGVMYSPSSAYDGTSLLTLNFNAGFSLF